jgi:UDP-N-acetylglucosamine acyltransferase
MLAGHCHLQDRVFLSGGAGVHQFSRIGRLAFVSGNSSLTRDLPPFLLMHGRDTMAGLNLVGLKRAGFSTEQIRALQRAHKILYRQGLPLSTGVEQVRAELGEMDVIREFLDFLDAPSHRRFARGTRGRTNPGEAA